MEKHIVAEETTEQIVPSIVVVVADAHTGLPTGDAQSRLLRHIGKGSVAVVLEQVGRGCLSGRPDCIQPVAVGEIDIQPTIVVIVEKGKPTSLGLDDRPLVVDAAPHVWNVQSRLFRHIHKLHAPIGGILRGFNRQRVLPPPQRRCEGFRQGAAHDEQ